jgi:hypothetical protein
MKYEVLEGSGEWIVQCDGAEEARFAEQDDALAYVAERLRDPDRAPGSYSLTMRYQARG